MAESAEVAFDLITIVLADDHALVRSGLRRLLEAEEDFRVVGEAGDADMALHLTRTHRPRIVLLDLNMPGTPSIDTIPSLREAAPSGAVVMLTMHDDAGYAREALNAGASAYVLKDAADTQLVEAVRAAAAGRNYLDPGLGARMATAPPPPPANAHGTLSGEVAIGSTFAGHRIDAIAGRGGMGVVFRATDLTLDRPVALKLIAPSLAQDPVFRARFERECRLAAAIDHPHAVEVFHAGQERGLLYVTMRFVEGTDLRALLREEGRLEPPRVLSILAQVAGALDEAHRHGLVHRDVKPANVLIASRARDGSERAFLTDFGVTKQRAVEAELTGTGLAIGTADYMAPEQAQGTAIDGRADVYALACVVFQALTGAVPYDQDSDLEKMWAHIHQPPPALRDSRPELPRELGDVLARAMAKAPADRQPTAGALAREALAAAVG
ncbi:MAG: protein kinase domain-containing protein [Solirubrobacteraceae bacterium]